MTPNEEKEEFQRQADKFRDSAFPTIIEFQYASNNNMKFISASKGLSKKEYFAAQILQGMMTTPDNIDNRKVSASFAVEIADALIDALEAGKR